MEFYSFVIIFAFYSFDQNLCSFSSLPDEIENRPEGLLFIVDEAALLFEGLWGHVQDQSLQEGNRWICKFNYVK